VSPKKEGGGGKDREGEELRTRKVCKDEAVQGGLKRMKTKKAKKDYA